MYTETRDSEVRLLKKLWCGDWVCPACGEIYRTIRMLRGLPED